MYYILKIMLNLKIKSSKYLPEFIYGGIDGLVTTFAIVSGATGANLASKYILILGFSNLLADGLAMGVGSYLSSKVEEKNKNSFLCGIATYFSFILIGLIPIIIYFAFYNTSLNLFLLSTIGTAFGFIFIGATKSFVNKSSYLKNIFETLFLGLGAALIAYYVGAYLETKFS